MVNPPTTARRRSPGTILRSIAGVQEAVLDEVPHERPRYTALGGLILGAAVLSVVSMAMAMQWVVASRVAAVAVALIWGLLILTLDRWLVSSITGSRGVNRLQAFIPRLMLAVLVGIVIAEPLVLAVFDREIEQQIKLDRAAARQKYESQLRACNPVPGTAEAAVGRGATAGCDSYLLALPDPGADIVALSGLKAQAEALEKQLDKDSKAYEALEDVARRECQGIPGSGLTGRAGEGPNCRRTRAQADMYRRDHRIDETASQLTELRQAIQQKQEGLQDIQSAAATARDHAISQRIAEMESGDTMTGVLARLSALQRLGDEAGHVTAATWLLRLLIVLIDTLPALTRLLMGTTAYDRIIAHQADQAIKTQFVIANSRRLLAMADERLARERKELEIAALRDQIELEASIDRLLVDSRRASLISRRATELRGESERTLAADIRPRAHLPAMPDEQSQSSPET